MISFALLESFFTQYGYAAVFLVLIACGFGVPIPEDVTLATGGVISGLGYANVHVMFLVGMIGVLAGDGMMFAAGRLYGDKILRFKPIARVMTPERYAQVQEKFDKYGNWVLFIARFLPGLRTPMFITAGISGRVSYMRFLIMDGFAALISVPLWVYLGDYGASNREWLMHKIHQFQYGLLTIVGIGILILCYFLWKKKQRTRFYRAKLSEMRQKRKEARMEKKSEEPNRNS
ncbi:MAG: DedA family protein [Neisseria sp.]|uniref:DedA family protein n=1 Tax=Neisseria sp. TaxID=192066 RepID=UPI0026DA8F12|nr:DedA family protein [Neisseria sp.]MDO4641638.1 DedA family protein [Neisseria sp.]